MSRSGKAAALSDKLQGARTSFKALHRLVRQAIPQGFQPYLLGTIS
jgi:hypothetical protein